MINDNGVEIRAIREELDEQSRVKLEISAVSSPTTPVPKTLSSQRTVRDRFRAKPIAGLRLEERDEELLGDVFWQRAMSRGQLQALYFGSLGRCNTRLRQLFDHGFLGRYFLPTAPFGAQAVYSLGRAAVPVVARRLEIEEAEVKKQVRSSRTPTFLEHTLAIVDMRLAFREAVNAHPDLQMERWLPEPLCRHEYDIRAGSSGRWQKEVFKPDGFVRLQHKPTSKYFGFFLEVDLGHTSTRQFESKIAMHQRYLESGLFEQVYGGTEFHTLVVTTGERRLANLKALAEARGSRLFRFATFAAIESVEVLGAVWQVPFEQQRHSLLWSPSVFSSS